MEVVYKLWEGSAIVRDRQSAIFTHPEKVHQIYHHGEYFNLDAIHLCELQPQRSPVIFQAGSSPKGQAFAAAHTECIFIGSTDIPGTKNVVDILRRLATDNGRQAEDLKILTVASVVVADTDKEAMEKFRDYAQYASHEGVLALMSGWSGIDMSAYHLQQHVANVTTEAI